MLPRTSTSSEKASSSRKTVRYYGTCNLMPKSVNISPSPEKRRPLILSLYQSSPDAQEKHREILGNFGRWLTALLHAKNTFPWLLEKLPRDGFVRHNVTVTTQNNDVTMWQWQPIRAKNYKQLVRPTREYASAAWDSVTLTLKRELEGVQRCAAHVCNIRATDIMTSTAGLITSCSGRNWEIVDIIADWMWSAYTTMVERHYRALLSYMHSIFTICNKATYCYDNHYCCLN